MTTNGALVLVFTRRVPRDSRKRSRARFRRARFKVTTSTPTMLSQEIWGRHRRQGAATPKSSIVLRSGNASAASLSSCVFLSLPRVQREDLQINQCLVQSSDSEILVHCVLYVKRIYYVRIPWRKSPFLKYSRNSQRFCNPSRIITL